MVNALKMKMDFQKIKVQTFDFLKENIVWIVLAILAVTVAKRVLVMLSSMLNSFLSLFGLGESEQEKQEKAMLVKKYDELIVENGITMKGGGLLTGKRVLNDAFTIYRLFGLNLPWWSALSWFEDDLGVYLVQKEYSFEAFQLLFDAYQNHPKILRNLLEDNNRYLDEKYLSKLVH